MSTRGRNRDRITAATARLVDIEVEKVRTDAMQSFLKQETIIVTVETADGLTGRGYSYTIGTGGRATPSMLNEHLLATLVEDSRLVEHPWRRSTTPRAPPRSASSPRSRWRPSTLPSGICVRSAQFSRCG